MITEGKYVSKRWLKKPEELTHLVKRLGYFVVGHLIGSDDYILQRHEKPESFYLFHISWGSDNAIEKYKLFRYSW